MGRFAPSKILGENMKNQTLLESDPFYICSRIKEIDENYFFIYNFDKNRFELHNSSQKGSTFSLAIPFDVLDERTLFLAKKSRIENMEKIIKEMDEENLKREQKLKKQAFEQIKEVIYDS